MAEEARPRATLGIEVGRARTIGLLLDHDGRELARAAAEHPPLQPRPELCEQDPEALWTAFRQIVARLKTLVEVELVGLGLAGEAGGLVFLDRAGRPVRRAILGADRRAVEEAREIVQRLGAARPAGLSGRPAGPCLPAAKILWLAANEPEPAQRVAKALAPRDLLRFRLTGELATDASEASASGLLDLAARQWSGPVLDALALSPDLLPEVFESAEVTGRVSVAGAAETGLPEGLPVVAGGTALACAALAAGLVEDGAGLAWLEPGAGLAVRADAALLDPEGETETGCDATGGWLRVAQTPLPAGALGWLAERLAPEWAAAARTAGLEPEAALLGEAATAAPGAGGLLFVPPHAARAGHGAVAGAWLGLLPGHGRREAARSVVEGLGFALAERLARLRETGPRPERLRLAGRAAGEEAWRTILAAQLGLPLDPLARGLEPARGAAMLAAIGVGLFADPAEAVARAGDPAGDRVPVDPQLAALYRPRAALWARAATLLATLAD